jgi:hypothetical protein
MIIGISVDNCLFLGKNKDNNKLIVDLELKSFSLKVERNLKDCLAVRLLKTSIILQPHLINKLIDKFGNEMSDKRINKTLGTPRFKISRPVQDCDTICESLQRHYRSGVGMLLYFIKYSRPDIRNAVKELSERMDRVTYGTNQVHHATD